ncbi:MAG: penicillin-binding protein 2, partial [Alcaligenaceae bacterium]|nr:penicillin-binding protein 2 [Alcaligenaceae bacterium]
MKRIPFFNSPVLDRQMPMWRAKLVFLLLMLGFAALFAKALYVQGMDDEFLQAQGERRYERTLVLPATRGKIFDRSGSVVLAASVPARAIWAIPEDTRAATEKQLAELARLLDMRASDISARVADTKRTFVYIKRQVSPEIADQVRKLNVPGFHQLGEMRRFYPENSLMAHVLGFTSIEDEGLEGVELAFNEALSGQAGSRRVIKDRLGRVIEDVQAVVPPVNGKDLHISIDAGLQYDTYTALKQAMEENKASAAAGVVLDVQTGEVLALVNLPSYDPNDRSGRKGPALRNRVMVDTFEPGSTMKPFTVALALESRKVTMNTMFDTGNGRYRFHGETISDVSRNGQVNVADIVRRSSNIGMAMISERLTAQDMWTTFSELGFGRAPEANFPGVAAGRLRPWERWRPIEQATMSYGYGLSVSLLQLAQAYSVFARDGDMVSLSLLKREGAATSKQIFSVQVARQVRGILEAAAGPDGAKLAQVQGYRVAGKSGTARKIVNGKYSKTDYRSSFVGFAPVSNPRIVVAVSIDEPRAGAYYG